MIDKIRCYLPSGFKHMEYLFYFVIGGLITTLIVILERAGLGLLSRLAALFPIFTWLAYLFIGTPKEVVSHAKFVLLGTLFAWVPYMLTIIYLSSKIGVYRAVLAAIAVFIITALIFSYLYYKF